MPRRSLEYYYIILKLYWLFSGEFSHSGILVLRENAGKKNEFWEQRWELLDRSWITKLDENELKEIDDACRPRRSSLKLTNKNVIAGSDHKIQSGPENRIIGGQLAPVGKYPFVGVFIYADKSITKCGATFISPRHMLTARHCFRGTNESFPLLAGGVCHSENNEDNCPKMDMVKLDYELIIFDSWANIETFGDIAILQLTESITAKYPGKISFACLPSSTDEQLPLTVTLLGWGNQENDVYTSHLRQVMVPIGNTEEEYILFGYGRSGAPDEGANHGDSGSGAVSLDASRRNGYVLWGIIRSGGWSKKLGRRQTFMLKTSYFLEDFCHYLGLCSPTQGFKKVLGLQPNLNLDGIYLPQGQRASVGKSVTPFKQIATELAVYIKNECIDFRIMGLIPTCELSSAGRSMTDWAMVIINAENVILCDAVSVTDQHVITSRECIISNLRRYHSGKVSKSNIVVRKRNCPGSDECVSYTIDFISWTFSHPMAIVQLVDSSKILQAIPACFLSSKENRMDMSEGLRGYGTVLKMVDDRNQICHQNDFFCAKTTQECEQEPLSATPTSGYGIMDIGSRTLAGIKIRELSQDNSIDVYWRTDNLIATLCIYLGRCDDESYSFLTKVAYFNNFYSINDKA
ncbi:trypsin domain-containing protein [Ditylenchus destructor]|nr:trypsin domain-containing protein [Ditylenchus destructor]